MSGTATKLRAEGEIIPRRKRKLLLVEWEDAAGPSTSGWRSTENVIQEPFMCRSIGWLVREGPTHITLAGHIGNVDGDESDEQVSGYMHIPRGMIRRQQVLKPPAWTKE